MITADRLHLLTPFLLLASACQPDSETVLSSELTESGTAAAGGQTQEAAGSAGGTGLGPASKPPVPTPWRPSARCVELAATWRAAMTPAEKAGQMVQADSAAARPADVADVRLGSILSGGGSDPSTGNSAEDWSSMVASYLAEGVAMGLPILYGVDAVHGHNNVRGAVIFPHNIGLGCTRDPALVEQIGRATALELRETGIHWTFAPVVAAGRDERWGRTYETYAETPELAAELGAALVRGLQGTNLNSPSSVLACAKHFAGDGATDSGTDRGNSTLSEQAFQKLAIEQYQSLVNAGVGSIMVSYSSFRGTKMSAAKPLLTDVLKGAMGFQGFLLSDWAAVQELDSSYRGGRTAPSAEAIASAINAGLDMIMEPYDFRTVALRIESLYGGAVAASRIDDAVQRILQVKCEMGLLEANYDAAPSRGSTALLGSTEHRQLARRAVRESLVLLQNDHRTLPLPKTGIKLLVSGTAADSAAKQCGGWTIDWQGLGTGQPAAPNPAPSDTHITTILAAIKDVVGNAQVTYSATGATNDSDFTHAVVVVGEAPYAEWLGDSSDLSLSQVSPADRDALTNVARLGLPTVALIISGRPLLIGNELPLADAWVAAWLPGSEGAGVADVLFGDHAPVGTLSHSWPRAMSQIPVNAGDPDYAASAPMYAYGFGLTYN